MFETIESFFRAAQFNLSLSTNATGITCFNEPNNIQDFEIIRNILKQMTSADRIVNWQEVTKYVWDSTTTTVLTGHCTVSQGTTSSKKSTGRSNRCLIWPNYKCYTPKNVRSTEARRLWLSCWHWHWVYWSRLSLLNFSDQSQIKHFFWIFYLFLLQWCSLHDGSCRVKFRKHYRYSRK